MFASNILQVTSVAMLLKCVEIRSHYFAINLLLSLLLKEFRNSVSIWDQQTNGLVFNFMHCSMYGQN